MELILILLIIVPLAGFVMQQYGLGVGKHAQSLLPGMDLAQVRIILTYFAANHHWNLIGEKHDETKSEYVFQAGKWGMSIYGARRIALICTKDADGVTVETQSMSLLGQLYNFGASAKDIDDMVVFMTGISTNNELLQKYLTYRGNFTVRQDLIDIKYFALIIACVTFLLVSYYNGYRDRQSAIPGSVIITFREGYTDEDMYKWMNDFGAGSCEHKPVENLRRFFCAVPIGAEQRILDAATLNFTVESATRWHGE